MDYLTIYKRLLAIAQAGLTYGNDVFDYERYTELKTISLELLQHLGDEPLEKLSALFAGETGYPTPKVDVRALITKDKKILLVQDIKTKEWSLPGGYAEVGLSPKKNIIKEVLEETGLIVETEKLLAVFDTNLRKDLPQAFQYYKLVFACKVIEEQSFKENNEVSQIAYFDLAHLPPLSLKRTTPEQLTQLLASQQDCFFE